MEAEAPPGSTTPDRLVHLPGTHLEGGGQLLRLASGLAALTSTPLAITNIRGNRSGGGGMKSQHLCAVSWLAAASGARTVGMRKGCKDVLFLPNRSSDLSAIDESRLWSLIAENGSVSWPREQKAQIDIGSPGAVTLVFQALLPFIIFSSSTSHNEPCNPVQPFHLTIRGGTNVTMSPSIDYICKVLVPMLELIGLPAIRIQIVERGWITGRPQVGLVKFIITPLPHGQHLPAFSLASRGEFVKLEAVIIAPRSVREVFEREVARAVSERKETADLPLEIEFEESGHPKRMYLLLVATADGGVRLGRDVLHGAGFEFREKGRGRGRGGRGGPAARKGASDDPVGDVVGRMVEKVLGDLVVEMEHGGCVDEFMRDQLVVFQALARGRSVVFGGRRGDGEGTLVEGSLHARTAEWVAGEVVGAKWSTDGSCEGIGYVVGGKDAIGEGTTRNEVDVVDAMGGLQL